MFHKHKSLVALECLKHTFIYILLYLNKSKGSFEMFFLFLTMNFNYVSTVSISYTQHRPILDHFCMVGTGDLEPLHSSPLRDIINTHSGCLPSLQQTPGLNRCKYSLLLVCGYNDQIKGSRCIPLSIRHSSLFDLKRIKET